MNGSRLQTLYVIKSMSITKTAMAINLILILLRLVCYARSFICGDGDFNNLHHWSTLLLIPYSIYLASYLMATVPDIEVHEKELLKSGKIDLNEMLDSRTKHNKDFSNTSIALYSRYLEVYLSNVFLCMFMYKEEYRALAYSIITVTVLSVTKLWINSSMKEIGMSPNFEKSL